MSKTKLDAERARAFFDYDPLTGVLTWKVSKGSRAKPGQAAGSVRKDGYLQVRVDGVIYLVHRLSWLVHTGKWPENLVDHENGNRSDNRKSNLRDKPRKFNQENQRRARVTSATGMLGSSPKRGKFRARITVDGVQKSLGPYVTAEEAHEAYLTAKRQLHAGCTI